jgi:signal transduction histidine kinase
MPMSRREAEITGSVPEERGGDRPLDSQQALAASIAREVQLGLPVKDSPEAITESVERALLEEARENERTLAYLRAAFLGVLAVAGVVGRFQPSLLGVSRLPAIDVAAASVSFVVALALLLALQRDWYRTWLRRGVPLLDAAIIVTVFLAFQSSAGRQDLWVPTGFAGVAATACVFLAFSGALRLSRSAARLSTGLAMAAWLVIGYLGGVRLVPVLLIAGLVVATGVLGTRITRMIRRVITNEVARLRLVQMYQEAQAAIDAREQVLGVVAHDLRNPLGTIKMAADLLLEEAIQPEEYPKYLNSIRRAGDRMNRLIRDLLDVARMEAGRLPIEPTHVEVPALIADVAEMMRPLAAEKGIGLDEVVPDYLPAVRVDPERIAQVFSNLIGNAIKFTPQGGHISLRAERMGEKIRMSVADTGPGIPPEQLSEIFGRFWQANRSDSRGLGLGLSIARGIVEAHGERIGVESRVGEGTEFWFTVPIARDGGASI